MINIIIIINFNIIIIHKPVIKRMKNTIFSPNEGYSLIIFFYNTVNFFAFMCMTYTWSVNHCP